MTRSQPNQPAYADLEIRILDRQAVGYPVELTVAGRQLPRGFLDPAALLPWRAGADPAADGDRLMRWLLADPQVKEAWDKANGLDGYCRIRLRIDAAAPELHTVPWELLRRPAGPGATAHDLAASDKTPFSRFLALPNPPGSQIVDERLRMLVAVADPANLARYQLTPIDRATEIAALEAAVAGLPVELTELTGPCTLPAIERALRRGYHALHFVGHGIYVEPEGAALYLADEDNQARPTWATELTAMLARLAGPDNALQLVFLGSCQTAVASPADAFRGLAPQLLQAGVPAVLAMQDLVPVLTYRAFAQAFYRQLMQHGAVDLAANQARAALLTAQLPGAAIPVLFSRVPDGKLLAIPGVDASAPAPGQPPYKGLRSFDVDDAADFHGRERLTAELVDFLRHNSLLAVVGASGSGKSSLVRAGLVHAMQSGQALADGVAPPEGSQNWLVHIITPTARPLESLAASLTRDSESVRAAAVLTDDLAQDPRSLDFYARRLLSRPGAGERLLLVVDQFEELFTLCKDKVQRRAFVDNLLAAACPEPDGCSPASTSTLVVITLRADFYAQCAEFDSLRAALERYQRYIGAMSQEELRRAIEQPAKRGGWELEPGLVDVLLDDVGDEPGALPLLSHALLETWKRRRGRTLTLAGYAASGRVQGAIAKTADQVYTRRLTPDQQKIARRIFLELTELGEGAPDTRRRVALRKLLSSGEATEAAEIVLRTLTDARLVTTFEDEAEVAHEALIREWPRLQDWITDSRQDLHVQRRLTQDSSQWALHQYDASFLYQGKRLVEVEEWIRTNQPHLGEHERSYVLASVAERERQKITEEASQRQVLMRQRTIRRTRWIAVALGLFMLIPLILVVQAVRQSQSAWQPAYNFPRDSVSALASGPKNPIDGEYIYCVGTSNIGIGCSRDGQTWNIYQQDLPRDETGPSISNGFPGTVLSVQALTIDATDQNRVFAFFWDGSVYRSDTGGVYWQDVGAVGLPNDDSDTGGVYREFGDGFWVNAVTSSDDLVLAVIDHALYGSSDGGEHWTPVEASNMPSWGEVYDVEFSAPGGQVYVATQTGLYQSSSAPTWEWEKATDLAPISLLAQEPDTDDGLFLITDSASERQNTIYYWRAGQSPEVMATVSQEAVALVANLNQATDVSVYVLLSDGEIIAVTNQGAVTSMGRRPGWSWDAAFDIMAMPGSSSADPVLMLGHTGGLMWYTKKVPENSAD